MLDMRKETQRNAISKSLYIGLIFLLAVSYGIHAQEGDEAQGKKLFKRHCASCHKLDKKSIGPALRHVADKRTKEWLHAWIKDNNALRASGDADAIAMFEEYNGSPMNTFPQLSEKDIDDIIAYTSAEPKAAAAPVAITTATAKQEDVSPVVLWVLLSFLVLLLFLLYRVRNTLKIVKGEKETTLIDDVKGVWSGFVKNQFLVFVAVVVFLLTGAYTSFDYLMNVGLDEGYQPIQPIAFSHKIHAGDNKIACEYCHSSASRSKTSGIPSVNVCMNCHKNISEYNGPLTDGHTKEFYDGEIQKIYDAIGWDPENVKYIEGYERKPVKWVRVHNLPDFVYFNHSQHVAVGEVKCQKCHGPVEEMEEVYQFAPLTMAWCVDCHRETDVKMKGNGYYAKIHEALAKKYGVEVLTVAQMGGLECGKCHY